VRENGLDNVTITGKVAHSEIPAYLERTHVMVSASRLEVQSLAIIESLASGTPVIGLSNETVDELVDEQVGVRLPGDASPEQFARQVERLCSLPPDEYERLCLNARQRVSGMDWDDVLELTAQAYETVIQARPRPASLQSQPLARLLAHLPPGKVRRLVKRQTKAFSARYKRVRRVTGKTWLFAGVNVLTSLVAHPFMRAPGTSFRWSRENRQDAKTTKAREGL
jgi:hypothetical protein